MANRTTRTSRESGRSVVLFVSDPSDSKHGEISVLDTAQEAERTIETLLEAGFEQQRIRVFCAAQVDFEISYRPVVTLLSNLADQGARSNQSRDNESERELVEVRPKGERHPAKVNSDNGHSGAESRLSSALPGVGGDVRDEAGLAPLETHMSKGPSRSNGRFSSLFRSVRDENYGPYAVDKIA